MQWAMTVPKVAIDPLESRQWKWMLNLSPWTTTTSQPPSPANLRHTDSPVIHSLSSHYGVYTVLKGSLNTVTNVYTLS